MVPRASYLSVTCLSKPNKELRPDTKVNGEGQILPCKLIMSIVEIDILLMYIY